MFYYELGGIENWQEVSEDEEWVKTKCVLNATSQVGLGTITPENLPKWRQRIKAVEEAGMVLTTFHGKPHPMPIEWVERRVGLRTNETSYTDKRFRELLKQWRATHAE